MKAVPYKFLAVLIAVALPVAFCRRAPGPDAPPGPARIEVLEEGQPETAALRVIAKEQIARAAAAGRRSLVESAALFGALNRLPPAVAEPPPGWYDSSLPIPADTEADRLCRQVVAWVRVALHDEPDRAAAAVARLEAEYFEELCERGAVRLPDPSSLTPVQELLEQARTGTTEPPRRAVPGAGGTNPKP